MARRHGGLGRGLDALIPMREEVEKAMKTAESEGMEILFADDEDFDEQETDFTRNTPDVSRETWKERSKKDGADKESVKKTEDAKESSVNSGSSLQSESDAVTDQESPKEEKRKPEISLGQSVESEAKESGSKEDQDKKEDIPKENIQEESAQKEDAQKESAEYSDRKDAVTVRIPEVEPNRQQHRKVFDEDKLEELAESIRIYGLLQPILVQRRDGYYEIIAGERRWRAALKAGLKEIPVIIREYTEKEILELSLIENIQREDLNPIEEAKAYKRLMDEFEMSQADVAQRVSKSRSAVANSMRLLKLDGEVQKMLTDGQISMGHARALLPLENFEKQLGLARKIVEQQLSVRSTEKLVKEMLNEDSKAEADTAKVIQPEEDPSIAIIYKQIEERLQQTLHTKVSIQRKRNGHGKLQIDFYNSDDLEKIIDRLTDR